MEKRLAITIGDCAGVGPEIILKAMPSYLDEVIVYGSFDVLSFYNEKHAYHYPLLKIDEPKDAIEKHLNIIDCADLKMIDFNIGALSPACGKAAYLYLENAVKDAMSHKVKAIVTCP
ncbi:MAG: 4-hydroxythreonine-4-phosphate dehydrogenase PdxA, partial [Erysipelotrichaceae bacterium]|nr:4-hydroxythreonine-4-phosphate dehydrogenase PdxA [Erysipelotrichaceae bacterium]